MQRDYDPPKYDIWEHYEIIRNYKKWLISEKANFGKTPPSKINYEILITSIVMQKLEKKMQIEFVGDILNLSIVQKETFHFIEPPTYAKTRLITDQDQTNEVRLLPRSRTNVYTAFYRLQ